MFSFTAAPHLAVEAHVEVGSVVLDLLLALDAVRGGQKLCRPQLQGQLTGRAVVQRGVRQTGQLGCVVLGTRCSDIMWKNNTWN